VSYPRGAGSPAGYYQHHIDAPGLLPSQLFESAGGLIIALILFLAPRHKKAFAGLQFYLLVVLYAVMRFFIEYTRVYGQAQMIGPFTHNQVICIVLFFTFGYLILKNILANSGQKKNATHKK